MTEKEGSLDLEDGVPPAEHGLSDEEHGKVEKARRPRAPVVYEIVRREGEAELRRPVSALWWSGLAAGISIGFSFLTEAALAANLPEAVWRPAVSKLGYCVGFLIVILGRQQLFTENVLTAVLPVITRWQLSWLAAMLRLWGVVLAANVAGCCVFAFSLAYLPLAEAATRAELAARVHHLMQNTPGEMFAKGIGGGWLIAALVWIIASAEGSYFLIIALLTYLIALFNFTHIVVGSSEVLYGCASGILPLKDAFFTFFVPVLAGNVCGGTVLFSLLCYAQVREEISVESSDISGKK